MPSQEIDYGTVSRVLETWDSARRQYKDGNFEKEFGKLIIDKFVDLQPRAGKFYNNDDMMMRHAESIVYLLVRVTTDDSPLFMQDSILQMLGPDMEFLEEILDQVGVRHAKMGVSVSFFPYLGQALQWALTKTLGEDQMTDDHREAWDDVYDMISNDIVKAILKAK
eukprot:scaffold4801_cov145-Amphora_coffeaeformis.AAC.1